MKIDPLLSLGSPATTTGDAATVMAQHSAANGDSKRSRARAMEQAAKSNSPEVRQVAQDMAPVAKSLGVDPFAAVVSGLSVASAIAAGELPTDDLAGLDPPSLGPHAGVD